MDRSNRRPICESGALVNAGAGVRFTVSRSGLKQPAFVVRYGDTVHAYINACTHRNVELDWDSGKFFDFTGTALICATHGARYHPRTGGCLGGPCLGGLTALPVIEDEGRIWLVAENGLDLA